uniref:RING-type domain-containing protein n=2 Tax=Arion vulgaris TaxID=1028688 RepID=A0A0B7AXL4_9EUPU
MGTGALTGHRRDSAGGTQDQEGPIQSFSSQNKTSNTNSSQNSPTSLPSSNNPAKKPLTEDSKIKSTAQMKMSCDRCSVNFSLFKRKKCCQECHRYFCSNCLPKPQSNSTFGRQCSKCRLLVSGHFSRDDLQTWKINDMRCFLNVRNISTKDCREKHDLIELVLARFCTRHRQSLQDRSEHETLVQQMTAHVRGVSFASPSSSTGNSEGNSPVQQRNTQAGPSPQVQFQTSVATTTESRAEVTTADTDNQLFPTLGSISSQAGNSAAGSSTATVTNGAANQEQEIPRELQFEINNDTLRELLESMERIQTIITEHDEREQSGPIEQPIRRTQLDDIAEISNIDDLSIRQLKELLVNNFVDYKGCCEKAELVEKTKRLWRDYQENKTRAHIIQKQDEAVYKINQHTKNSSKDTVVLPPEVLEKESATLSTVLTAEAAKDEEKHPDMVLTDIPSEETAATRIATVEPVVGLPEVVSSSGEFNSPRSDSLCHICMDSLVDCILLECGHMVTCTQCGKRLADCPICRQYIARVVRVFRS